MIPVKNEFKITAIFGQEGDHWANGHKGIDFTAKDKNVYSACSGTVRVVAYDANGWGKYISIGDANGNRHIYCHLNQTLVQEGKKVKAGDVIGIMGKTGNSTGVHLHYQVNNSAGVAQNAAAFLGIPNEKGEYDSRDFDLFKDEDKISPWAKDAVYQAKENGYMVGDADGNFRPKDPLTREEMAVILEKIKK